MSAAAAPTNKLNQTASISPSISAAGLKALRQNQMLLELARSHHRTVRGPIHVALAPNPKPTREVHAWLD